MTAAVLLLCTATALLLPTAAGAAAWETEAVKSAAPEDYRQIPVYEAGKQLPIDARLINGTTYVALRAFAESITDCTIVWNAKTRTAVLTAKGLSMTVSDQSNYLSANERYLYHQSPSVILSNGSLYVPVRLLAKAFGTDILWNGENYSIDIEGEYAPILHGKDFYNADDVYWLSRIISAESRGEPLLGQIAVGNVVLNRMRSPLYPNTIYGVIFDRKYGTQFSPVSLGTIYQSPYYLSVVAAKICLEGTSIDDRILFFFEPKASTSTWIQDTRKFAFRIQNHYFYY